MFKSIMAAGIAGVVLGSGLVSCSPDQKTNVTKDVYKAKPPRILKSGSSVQLKAEDMNAVSGLDLRDELDFRESAPARIEIRTTCKGTGGPWFLDVQFPGDKPVEVFRLLQPILYTKDLAKERIDCIFEIALFNSAGSDHRSTMNAILSDTRESRLTIAKDGQKETRMRVGQMEHINIRYADDKTYDAQLYCQDAALDQLKFTQVLPLNAFNFAKLKLNKPDQPQDFKAQPLQRCRVFLMEGQDVAALSRLLEIYFPPAQLEVHRTGPISPGRWRSESILLHEIHLVNTEPVERLVIYQPRRFNAHLRVAGRSNTYDPNVSIKPILFAEMMGPHFISVETPNDSFTAGEEVIVRIPPRGSGLVRIWYSHNWILQCPVMDVVTISLREALEFQVADLKRETSETLKIESLPAVEIPTINYARGTNYSGEKPMACIWR